MAGVTCIVNDPRMGADFTALVSAASKPFGTTYQIQHNNADTFDGFTLSGDGR